MTGFIAQDVERAFPRWVGTDAEGFKTLAVPPRELAALEVEAFRALKDRADKADAKAAALEARLNALEANHPHNVANNIGLGMFGIALAGVYAASRRKKDANQA